MKFATSILSLKNFGQLKSNFLGHQSFNCLWHRESAVDEGFHFEFVLRALSHDLLLMQLRKFWHCCRQFHQSNTLTTFRRPLQLFATSNTCRKITFSQMLSRSMYLPKPMSSTFLLSSVDSSSECYSFFFNNLINNVCSHHWRKRYHSTKTHFLIYMPLFCPLWSNPVREQRGKIQKRWLLYQWCRIVSWGRGITRTLLAKETLSKQTIQFTSNIKISFVNNLADTRKWLIVRQSIYSYLMLRE